MFIERNLIDIYKGYLDHKKKDTADMLNTFNNLASEWYNVSIDEPNKESEELGLIGEALHTLIQ